MRNLFIAIALLSTSSTAFAKEPSLTDKIYACNRLRTDRPDNKKLMEQYSDAGQRSIFAYCLRKADESFSKATGQPKVLPNLLKDYK